MKFTIEEIKGFVDSMVITDTEGKIKCLECGHEDDQLMGHLLTGECILLDEYLTKYPGSEISSCIGRTFIDASFESINEGHKNFNIKKTFNCALKQKTIRGYIEPRPETPDSLGLYCFRPELLNIILYVLATSGEHLFLYGASGTGKTSAVEQVASALNLGVCRVNHDGDIGRAEIVGQWILNKDRSMSFSYGLLAKAMKEGHVFIADEFDFIDSSVGMVYQPVLEGKALTILETGEVIKPHPEFRFIATGNTFGQGDVTGMYNGAKVMNEATMQRFTLFEEVTYPSPEEENVILEHICLISDIRLRERMLEVCKLVRKAFIDNEISIPMSTRILINVANKLITFGSLKKAYHLAFTARMNENDRAVVIEIIQRVWGSDYEI